MGTTGWLEHRDAGLVAGEHGASGAPPGQRCRVEADGASYHCDDTARDRDRLRQDHLERLGWHFHRIWSTDWFHDRDFAPQVTLAT